MKNQTDAQTDARIKSSNCRAWASAEFFPGGGAMWRRQHFADPC